MTDKWAQMPHWWLVLPPSRPDEHELQHVRQVAGGIDRSLPVAVLGSTPEFRDLLHDLGFVEIFVLDRSKVFLEQMTREMAFSPSGEMRVVGDWLQTLKQCRGKFALILSDLTSGNIPYSARSEFYELIAEALRSDGYFIDKNLTHEYGFDSVASIVRRFQGAPINILTANYFNCRALFCSELIASAGVVDTTALYIELARRLVGSHWARLLEMTEYITPRGLNWYYGMPWKELEPGYCAGLQLVGKADTSRLLPYYRKAFQFTWRKL